MEEYRLLNGWSRDRKRGSSRYDRIPQMITDEFYIGSPKEYGCMIPAGLPAEFTAKDYAKASGLALRYAQTAMTVLRHIDVIRLVRKEGRAHVYRLSQVTDDTAISLPRAKE